MLNRFMTGKGEVGYMNMCVLLWAFRVHSLGFNPFFWAIYPTCFVIFSMGSSLFTLGGYED